MKCEIRAKRASRWWAIFLAVYLCAFLTAESMTSVARAQLPAGAEQQVRAHLDAAEFGPALAAANQVADPAARDRLLAQVARAQVAGGARQAARTTLDEISDDRIRSGAIDQIVAGSVPPSGGARGGATMADFDTLIDLITQTIAPTTWDTVGGPGAIDGFPGGVYVDTSGLMQQVQETHGHTLAALRQASLPTDDNAQVDRTSPLRKVSLTRLERQLQLRRLLGQGPTEAMSLLAGIYKVRYLFLYPETGDIVIAGPAGAWTGDDEGRAVNADNQQPVLHLDDFVVLLRNASEQGGRFTCSITPRQENLAATHAYLNQPPGATSGKARFQRVRDLLGKQEIEVQGLDPHTRVARVIVEADYHMKLIGMGLEEGVFGVTSYLDSIPIGEGEAPPPMSVLRWWFTMNYDAVRATADRQAFEVRGPGAKVLSENEMLTERGERVHTGRSDDLNAQFAHSFSKHFDDLTAKYPIYAELRNVFDLALVAALIVAEDLPERTGWYAAHFRDPQRYCVQLGTAPTDVETVLNTRTARTAGKVHTIAGVSGGVSADANPYVQEAAIEIDEYGVLEAEYHGATAEQLPRDAWWWD
jgi:hypothetical protein